MARALPTGMTSTIGLVLSDITNPVYFDVVRGAGQAAAVEGYTLVLAESQESPGLEAQTVQRLLGAVDGLVLMGTRLAAEEIENFSIRKPVMLVNRAITGLPSVIPDVESGIGQALDHFRELGHTSIAFLSGPKGSWINAVRWEAILTGAIERRMAVVEIGPGLPTIKSGEKGLRRIRAAGVTAVITYNDLMAIGLLTACHDAGVSVPNDLSIIGFDDIFGSAFTSPPLTTIRTPLKQAGEEAVRRLIGETRGHVEPAFLPGLTTQLIKRGSTTQTLGYKSPTTAE
jgi:LacI family transcriptional regulator